MNPFTSMLPFYIKRVNTLKLTSAFTLLILCGSIRAQVPLVWRNEYNKLKKELNLSIEANKSTNDSLAELKIQIEFLRKKLENCELKYNTQGLIKIGSTYWDPEDFNVTITRNGDSLKLAKNDKDWKKYYEEKVPCYTKIPTNSGIKFTSGYLYNYWAVVTFNEWAPENKEIPTRNDYETLKMHIKDTYFKSDTSKNIDDSLALHLKSTKNWSQFSGTNKSGLNLCRGGFFSNDGFSDTKTNYWLAPENKSEDTGAISIADFHNKLSIFTRNREDNYGYLIRCIKK